MSIAYRIDESRAQTCGDLQTAEWKRRSRTVFAWRIVYTYNLYGAYVLVTISPGARFGVGFLLLLTFAFQLMYQLCNITSGAHMILIANQAAGITQRHSTRTLIARHRRRTQSNTDSQRDSDKMLMTPTERADCYPESTLENVRVFICVPDGRVNKSL